MAQKDHQLLPCRVLEWLQQSYKCQPEDHKLSPEFWFGWPCAIRPGADPIKNSGVEFYSTVEVEFDAENSLWDRMLDMILHRILA